MNLKLDQSHHPESTPNRKQSLHISRSDTPDLNRSAPHPFRHSVPCGWLSLGSLQSGRTSALYRAFNLLLRKSICSHPGICKPQHTILWGLLKPGKAICALTVQVGHRSALPLLQCSPRHFSKAKRGSSSTEL